MTLKNNFDEIKLNSFMDQIFNDLSGSYATIRKKSTFRQSIQLFV